MQETGQRTQHLAPCTLNITHTVPTQLTLPAGDGGANLWELLPSDVKLCVFVFGFPSATFTYFKFMKNLLWVQV